LASATGLGGTNGIGVIPIIIRAELKEVVKEFAFGT
jgi:hypothetical protein